MIYRTVGSGSGRGPPPPYPAAANLLPWQWPATDRLGAASSPNDTIAWFVLLGLGLSPVMVGTTNVIVGSAPERAGGALGPPSSAR